MNIVLIGFPILGLGLNLLLAFTVILRDRRSFMHRIFAVFLLGMALWALSILGMRASADLESALVWEKITFAVLPLVAVSFYHSVLLLTGDKGKRRVLLVAYLCMAAGIALVPTELVVASMREMWYGHGFIGGPLLPLYMVVFYGFVILGLYQLMKARRRSRSRPTRNRYVYLALGGCAGLFGLLGDAMAASGVRIYPMGIPSNILFSLLTSYAILKYNLLDFGIVVRKGTVFVFLFATAAGLVAVTLGGIYLLGLTRAVWQGWPEAVFVASLTVIVMLALRWMQQRVDRWFDRDKLDYLKILEDLNRDPKPITDLDYISTSLVTSVGTALRCPSVALLLPDADEKSFHLAGSAGIDKAQSFSLGQDTVLVWWLKHHEEVIARSEIEVTTVFRAMSVEERRLLDKMPAEIFAPLLNREGLRGILVLSRKTSDHDYSADETRMLRIVGRQIATALDNARLYDVQTKRYREQAMLARLSTTISAEMDLPRIYQRVGAELEQTVSFACLSVNRLDEHGRTNVAFTLRGPAAPVPGSECDFALIPPVTSAAYGQTTDLQYTPDLALEARGNGTDEMLNRGIRSLIRFPLRSEGAMFGEMILGGSVPDAFHSDDIRLLQQVAVQLAIAIEKSSLYESERQARVELEKKEQERRDLVNSLVHEIKTPLTAIIASSELLKEELVDAATLGPLADNLDVAAHKLDHRISELMDFARLQYSDSALRLESLDVNQIISHVGTLVTPLVKSKQQSLKVELAGAPCLANADPDRVTQILLNLVTNALKFTGPNGTVYVRSAQTDRHVLVEVQDSAKPITPAEMENLFKPDHTRNRGEGSGGLGLGLFICKKLVELQNGKIWVELNKPGNSFKFTLPLASGSEVK